ncbi:MAG TPA: carboxypeptidase-like regulatory domain-containing protein [Pirellulales bacterium]|nr:carboxypeptidase-like regulatory domain-containing protein [Pirellulales bacterium]
MRRLLALFPIVVCATLDATATDTLVVRGMVREHETGRPVAGAVVLLSNGRIEARARSNADGRYECRLPPGTITGQVLEAPSPLVKPLRAFHVPFEMPPGATEANLPPVELRRGQTVKGRVVDNDGKPVTEAEVQVGWYVLETWREGFVRGPKWLVTRSDDHGEFSFDGIDSILDPWLANRRPRFWAAGGGLVTETLTSLPPQRDAPVELRLSRKGSVSLSGRVVDLTGQPIEGARVEVWTQWRDDDVVIGEAPVLFTGHRELVTNNEGRFETPRPVGRGGEYRVTVRADGYLPASSAWLQPGPGTVAELSELQLRRLRTIEGHVVDHDGRPLAGVRVFQSGDGVEPTETVSGDDGGFTLSGVVQGPAFVFAECDGYRFFGQAAAQSAPTEIVLAHHDQAVAPPQTDRDAVLAHEEELALARRVVRPFVDRALESGNRNERYSALRDWARLDPGDALDRLDRGVIPDLVGHEKDALRTWAAKSLIYDDFNEAAALVESIENVSRRLEATILLAVTSPLSAERRRDLLENAVLHLALADDPGGRALWLECSADALLDLGESRRAASLLEEARALAGTLPLAGSAGSPRRRVAEVLARIDLPAALELIKDLAEDAYRDETHGQIAYRVANRQPAEAEEVLEMVRDPYCRERWTERICSRMAPTDPRRARKLAASVSNPYRRALALGWMAGARAAADPVQARDWLDDAFAELGRLVAAGEARQRGPQSAAVAAALLLPVAETIGPGLARDYFWRTVSFRISHFDGDEQDVLADAAALALLLARYDRPTARRLLEPVVELFERRVVSEMSECGGIVISAMYMIDPRWAAELVERQGSQVHRFGYWRDESPWSAFAWMSGTRPEVRTRIFLRDYLGGQYWLPGGPDNAFHTRF